LPKLPKLPKICAGAFKFGLEDPELAKPLLAIAGKGIHIPESL
jgi:hypothetical protein